MYVQRSGITCASVSITSSRSDAAASAYFFSIQMRSLCIETALIDKHANVIDYATLDVQLDHYVGLDEVGRGPLAGPVVAAAVVLGEAADWREITDSKALTAQHREQLCSHIKQHASAWSLGRCECHEIDHLNIFNASLLAMQRAFEALPASPELALVDGKYSPVLSIKSYAVIKGDLHVPAIGAASIIAKVARDQEMVALDRLYPAYGFAQNKGYPTPTHLAALRRHGACQQHRKSFKPVADVCHDA